jgi:hypothetical protein
MAASLTYSRTSKELKAAHVRARLSWICLPARLPSSLTTTAGVILISSAGLGIAVTLTTFLAINGTSALTYAVVGVAEAASPLGAARGFGDSPFRGPSGATCE